MTVHSNLCFVLDGKNGRRKAPKFKVFNVKSVSPVFFSFDIFQIIC